MRIKVRRCLSNCLQNTPIYSKATLSSEVFSSKPWQAWNYNITSVARNFLFWKLIFDNFQFFYNGKCNPEHQKKKLKISLENKKGQHVVIFTNGIRVNLLAMVKSEGGISAFCMVQNRFSFSRNWRNFKVPWISYSNGYYNKVRNFFWFRPRNVFLFILPIFSLRTVYVRREYFVTSQSITVTSGGSALVSSKIQNYFWIFLLGFQLGFRNQSVL